MSLKESATLDVGFPIMSAKFINNKTVLVTGGGGEGNNGIPNKITAIKCSFKVQDPKRRLQRFREITLPSNEDSPQCLDTGKIVDDEENKFSVFVGCNQSSQLIRSMNINNNLRKYVYTNEEHLRFVDAAQLEEEIVGDVDDYPKVIRLSTNSGVGSFMTSSVPSAIYIFNPDSLELKFKYKPEKEVEIKDFALSPEDDGKTLVYVTSNSIEAVSTSDASKVSTSIKNTKTDSELKKFILSKVRFLNNDIVIVSASSRGSKGAVLLKYSLSEQKILKQSLISKKFNNIVALDISQSQDLVAVAGNDLSLTVIRLSDFKVLSTYPKLHPFAITSVAFSPNGSKLATGSAANTLHVFRVPQHHARGKSTLGTLFQYLFTILFVAFIAFGLQKSHESGQLDELVNLSQQYIHNAPEYFHNFQSGEFFQKSKEYFQSGELLQKSKDYLQNGEYIQKSKEYVGKSGEYLQKSSDFIQKNGGVYLQKSTELSKKYGVIGYQYASKYARYYGKLGYSYILEKIRGENVEGDDDTKKYFSMGEWEDAKSDIFEEASDDIYISNAPTNDQESDFFSEITDRTETATTAEEVYSTIASVAEDISELPVEDDAPEEIEVTTLIQDEVHLKEVTKDIEDLTKNGELDTESFFSNEDNYIETSFESGEPSQTAQEDPSAEASIDYPKFDENTESVSNDTVSTEEYSVKEPNGPASIIEEAVIEEPNTEVPLADKPVVDIPIVEQPVIDEPIVEDVTGKPPIIEEPVVQEPVVQAPVVQSPVVQAPVVKEPVVEEPVVEAPVVEAPIIEAPVIEEPIIKQPVVEEPVVEEPIINEPVQEPVVEETIVKSPVIEAPVIEEPIIKEPIIKEPIIEEPVVGSPAVEDSSVQQSVESQVAEKSVVEEDSNKSDAPVVDEKGEQEANSSKFPDSHDNTEETEAKIVEAIKEEVTPEISPEPVNERVEKTTPKTPVDEKVEEHVPEPVEESVPKASEEFVREETQHSSETAEEKSVATEAVEKVIPEPVPEAVPEAGSAANQNVNEPKHENVVESAEAVPQQEKSEASYEQRKEDTSEASTSKEVAEEVTTVSEKAQEDVKTTLSEKAEIPSEEPSSAPDNSDEEASQTRKVARRTVARQDSSVPDHDEL